MEKSLLLAGATALGLVLAGTSVTSARAAIAIVDVVAHGYIAPVESYDPSTDSYNYTTDYDYAGVFGHAGTSLEGDPITIEMKFVAKSENGPYYSFGSPVLLGGSAYGLAPFGEATLTIGLGQTSISGDFIGSVTNYRLSDGVDYGQNVRSNESVAGIRYFSPFASPAPTGTNFLTTSNTSITPRYDARGNGAFFIGYDYNTGVGMQAEGGIFLTNVSYSYDAISAVPEPNTWSLFFLGVGLGGVYLRRRRSIRNEQIAIG